jgi:hypothetical protein
MFGWGFADKVRGVLRAHFRYQPDPVYQVTLVKMAKDLYRLGHNEYDAACMFMLTLMNSLSPSGGEVTEFVRAHTDTVTRLIPMSNFGSQFPPLIEKLRAAHEVSVTQSNSKYPAFDSWFTTYKAECARINSALAPNENGTSLIDFMQDEPLRRAHRDGIDPKDLAAKFAPSFDITTFGMGGPVGPWSSGRHPTGV